MLQIVTKMYFREGVPLHSTVQRDILFTNRDFLRSATVELRIAELAPSTTSSAVSSVAVAVTEFLEAENEDGTPSILVATSGEELIDDLAAVLSFGLNAVFSRDTDLVRRLVLKSLAGPGRRHPNELFRWTFDPGRFVSEEELDAFRAFFDSLLGLERNHYERAIRAIKRMVRAVQLAAEDPSVAYADLVVALESLSHGIEVPLPDWERLDAKKRELFDGALEDADEKLAAQVREAVVQSERLGARSRFLTFVKQNIAPKYFRESSVGATAPIREADLDRALRVAYDIRSGNVHELEELPPEVWVLGGGSDTLSAPDLGLVLTLEGLARLARHVIRNFIEDAPKGTDPTFDWRASVPGRVRVYLGASQWIGNADGFDDTSACRYLVGFIDEVIESLAGRSEGVADISAVLERIEDLLPGTAGEARVCMLAIYGLWHKVLVPELHRPGAADFLKNHGASLEEPSLPAFLHGLLTNELPPWSADQWQQLATERRQARERSGKLAMDLSPRLDAALQVLAAESLQAAARADEAREHVAYANGEAPGVAELIDWEERFGDPDLHIDLAAVVMSTKQSP